MDMIWTIGERIRHLRKIKNMTQSALAERVNVTKSAISAYEKDIRQPSYDVLIKIAQIFHVSTDNLLGFSAKYAIDVSELTPEQRMTVSEIVLVYKGYNVASSTVKPNSAEYENLKEMGLMGKNRDAVNKNFADNDTD